MFIKQVKKFVSLYKNRQEVLYNLPVIRSFGSVLDGIQVYVIR